MLMKIFAELGPWNWWVLGMILLGLEIIAPGAFMIWFGLAAIVVGTLTIVLGSDAGFWNWQLQLLAFAILSLIFGYGGRTLMKRAKMDASDNPNINDRGGQLIGRIAVVCDPIREGRGRVKLGDTTWSVSGPELPVGTRVRVIGRESALLQVEPENGE